MFLAAGLNFVCFIETTMRCARLACQRMIRPLHPCLVHTSSSRPAVRAAAAETSTRITQYESYELSSLLLLLHESVRRAVGRPLVEVNDLLTLDATYRNLACCVLAYGQPQQAQVASGKLDGAQASSTALGSLLYSNHAAELALGGQDYLRTTPGQTVVPALPCPQRLVACSNQEDGKANSTTKNGTGSSVGSSSSSHAPVHMNVHHRAVLNAAAGSGIIIDTLLSCGIISPTGVILGQVLLFDAWSTTDGKLGRPLLPQPLAPNRLPTADSIQAYEECVRQQAAHVRALKQQTGSASSQDAGVAAAVADLQALKMRLLDQEHVKLAFSMHSSHLQHLLHAVGMDRL